VPSFQDSNGREWTIRLDGVLLKELREATQINLADIGGASYALLNRDPSALTQAICVLCADQFQAAGGITSKQFAAALVGESLDKAWECLWWAAKVFFPARLWSALQLRYNQQIAILDGWETLQPLLTMLSKPEVPAGMRDAAMAELAKMIHGMSATDLRTLADQPSATGPVEIQLKLATDSPATAESAPAA